MHTERLVQGTSNNGWIIRRCMCCVCEEFRNGFLASPTTNPLP